MIRKVNLLVLNAILFAGSVGATDVLADPEVQIENLSSFRITVCGEGADVNTANVSLPETMVRPNKGKPTRIGTLPKGDYRIEVELDGNIYSKVINIRGNVRIIVIDAPVVTISAQ